LVVHIRSGDIFRRKDPHHGYGQPPVAFYERIFSLFPSFPSGRRRVVFVSSNESLALTNPIITYYKALIGTPQRQWTLQSAIKGFSSAVFQQSNDLKDDFQLLMCARYFVAARSTFSGMIIDLSPRLKEFYHDTNCDHWNYRSPYADSNYYGYVLCHRIALPNYLLYENWTNSKDDRLMMINYNHSKKFLSFVGIVD
jgi:hypothetical protein